MSSVDKVIFVGSPGVGRSVGSFSRLDKYSYDLFIFIWIYFIWISNSTDSLRGWRSAIVHCLVFWC